MEDAEMTDNPQTASAAKQDRSPSFPYIGLTKSLERLRQLFDKAKRFEVRLDDAGKDWGFNAKSSSTFQTVGALIAYGLLDNLGSKGERKVKVSDIGWRILEDARPGVREQLLAEAALKPKVIAEYAERWKDGRPDDAHCISQLKFESKFTHDGAVKFLTVFDDAIGFTKGIVRDSVPDIKDAPGRQNQDESKLPLKPHADRDAPLQSGKVAVMQGERELTTGLLSKEAQFRLIVSGPVGVKEIDRLIRKLELDKEILADQDSDDTDVSDLM
jgi:hypothetical protein